ncbi:MAG TPA: S9 family peptidase [Acidimicrobiales bacterium]|nr:S9 family peptidase [Acidimicrobiales bacterium]
MITQLLQAKSTVLADVEDIQGRDARLLALSNMTGTMQLYEVASQGEMLPLTDLPEPVSLAKYVPGRRMAVLEVDRGGDERHQLYTVDLEKAAKSPVQELEAMTALTSDPAHVHNFAGLSRHGDLLAYLSNRRNGVDFDLWAHDLSTGQRRLVYDGGGWCDAASGFSPDGRFVSAIRPGARPLDTDLLLIDIHSGEVIAVLPHPDEAAIVGPPAWQGPKTFCVSSNIGNDMQRVVRYDLATGASRVLEASSGQWDTGVVASPDGLSICLFENRNGSTRLSVTSWDRGDTLVEVPLPQEGVVVRQYSGLVPQFSRDGAVLYFNFTSPLCAGDIWAFDRPSQRARRVTQSPSPVPATDLVEPEVAEVTGFDGERIPLFVFRPRRGAGRPPVVVVVHGGPEAQATRVFDPMVQAFAAAGYAVVVPNVRGSTGYGKRYAALDDTTKRLDSVRDLEAVHGFLARSGLDETRAALFGGSYGGYMVLAGLAFQPHLWAAGVDIVGVSDLTTFLQNTAPYRRSHREREYGSLEHDREFLEKASPLRSADHIRAPLFVVHGRNDPRVPVSEAEQLVRTVRAQGNRCELVVYEDEGHGLARLANRLDAYPKILSFLDEVLAVGK